MANQIVRIVAAVRQVFTMPNVYGFASPTTQTISFNLKIRKNLQTEKRYGLKISTNGLEFSWEE